MNKIPFNVYDFFAYLASGFLLLTSVDYAFGFGWLATQDVPLGIGLYWLIVTYVLGHLIAHVSSFFLENIIMKKLLRFPEEYLFKNFSKLWWCKLFPNDYKPFPVETKNRIIKRAEEDGYCELGEALFIHCHTIALREQVANERVKIFRNLYGFTRNISMTFLLSAIVLMFSVIWNGTWISLNNICVIKLLCSLACFLTSYIMFLRSLKFFRLHRTEVFLTYAE